MKILVPVKRVPDLVKAADAVLTERDDAFFLLVGEGETREHTMQLSRRLGLDSAVRFLPWVTRGQMARLYRLADCLVMPSRAEGLSLAALEAQSAGCVVVATTSTVSKNSSSTVSPAFCFPSAI